MEPAGSLRSRRNGAESSGDERCSSVANRVETHDPGGRFVRTKMGRRTLRFSTRWTQRREIALSAF